MILYDGATVSAPLPQPGDLTVADRWVLSRLNEVIGAVDAGYDDFEFAKISDLLYHFAWDEVCDWYVELAKIQMASGGDVASRTRLVLGHVFDALLRLLHPLVPFVSDELWRALTGGPSVMVASWPNVAPGYAEPDPARTAIAMIARLSRDDFGPTAMRIDADGGLTAP